jgi:hypothetical protein
MPRRYLLHAAAVAVLAPSLSYAQARSAPVTPRGDTMSVALIAQDSVAAGRVDLAVRARHREVQFCFEESGLKTDPELSGVFAIVLTLDTLGVVSRVDPTHREWSSPDGAGVEACVMERARTWKFPVHIVGAPARHEVTFHFAR